MFVKVTYFDRSGPKTAVVEVSATNPPHALAQATSKFWGGDAFTDEEMGEATANFSTKLDEDALRDKALWDDDMAYSWGETEDEARANWSRWEEKQR